MTNLQELVSVLPADSEASVFFAKLQEQRQASESAAQEEIRRNRAQHDRDMAEFYGD